MKFFLLLLLLTATGFAAPANQEKQADPFISEYNRRLARNPEVLLFTVRLKENRKQFHLGEMITLELSFATSKPNTFTLDAATYDRSGRLHSDGFAFDKRDAVVDPIADYFNSRISGYIMGGIRGIPDLTDKPLRLSGDLIRQSLSPPSRRGRRNYAEMKRGHYPKPQKLGPIADFYYS